ncbi:hypothetical protein [Mangrovivirga cuniculi]|uniref:hypothetical protein n=1 Tax=Mangrovivirga cuniculi TaxID=2715131 RepID=UPI0026BC822B
MSVERHVLKIASELNLPIKGVTATVELLEEGATILSFQDIEKREPVALMR